MKILVEEVPLECRTTVKQMDQDELVDLPNWEVRHFTFEKHPTEAGKWSRSFEEEALNREIVALSVINGEYDKTNETKEVMNKEKGVEESEVDVR